MIPLTNYEALSYLTHSLGLLTRSLVVVSVYAWTAQKATRAIGVIVFVNAGEPEIGEKDKCKPL